MDAQPPLLQDELARPTSGAVRVALLALVLAALALRLIGLDHGLPHRTEPDGVKIAAQTELMRSGGSPELSEDLWGFYPHLIARLASLAPAPAPSEAGAAIGEHLERASRSYGDPRRVVALISLLAVPGTFLLARRFLSQGWSLLAAGLAGASTLTLWFSHQARPHAAAGALALLAVVAALRVLEQGHWTDVLLAGCAAALAIGTLQFGVFVLPPIALALLLRRGASWRWRAASLACVLAFVALSLLALSPYLFAPEDAAGKLGVRGEEFKLSGHTIYMSAFSGGGFGVVLDALRDYEPWIAAWAALGLVVLLVRRFALGERPPRRMRDELWIVLAYVVPFLIVIGLYARTYQRFVIPLVPYLCVLAACGPAWMCARLGVRRAALAVAIASIVLAPQLAFAGRLACLQARPDTVAEAAHWLEQNLAPGRERIFVMPTFDLPLPLDREALDANMPLMGNPARPWFRWQLALAPESRLAPGWKIFAMPLVGHGQPEVLRELQTDCTEFLRKLDADFVVLEVFTPQRQPLMLGRFRPALAKIADRVARFNPDLRDRGDNLPLAYADDGYGHFESWALRLWRARCMGPTVEIWKLRR